MCVKVRERERERVCVCVFDSRSYYYGVNSFTPGIFQSNLLSIYFYTPTHRLPYRYNWKESECEGKELSDKELESERKKKEKYIENK